MQNGDETGIDCGGSNCAPCQTVACEAATGLSSSPRKRGREALLSWNAANGAGNYSVELRQQGASAWSSGSTSSTSITATGLTNGATYEWRVTSNCAGGATATSPIAVFVAGQSARITAPAGLSVFPNPALDVLYVNLDAVAPTGEVLSLGENTAAPEAIELSILDATGRRLRSLRVTAYDTVVQINVGDLARGLYFVRAQDLDGELLGTARFVISR